ncbi:zinc finger MYND domain-containing protein 15-like [Watersipora subatra]|uniref:zinc finger MYND domain-containing protein 15-like n=1 Tax=Watersipora subatra TaxID=2589382 RepID=UPI00355C422C
MVERTCHHCSEVIASIRTCASCNMVFYCSESCLTHHNADKAGCSKMSYYSQLTPPLLSLPFTFAEETCSETFDDRALINFLKRQGVFNLGLWVRETPLSVLGFLDVLPFGELETVFDPYVLPIEGLALENHPIAPLEAALASWEGYYKWRGFPLSSPIAILLHHVMTVYHILQSSGVASQPESVVLLAGVEKEADLLITFLELSSLLPGKTISVIMVGPSISAKISGNCFKHDNLTVSRYCMTLQEYLRSNHQSCSVDVIICLNAGLAAYTSWRDAIVEIVKRQIRCYITDFCLLSLDMSQQALLSLTLQLESALNHMNMNSDLTSRSSENLSVKLSEPVINPFRCPVRKFCESARFPWFSNAFICELIFC